jgi:hypothetical protein
MKVMVMPLVAKEGKAGEDEFSASNYEDVANVRCLSLSS